MATTYKWAGKTRMGTIQSGEIAAESREEVVAYLRRQNILPTKITARPKAIRFKLPALKAGKVKDKDIVVFTRQFSTMIDAGLPLVQCLDILSRQTENKALAKTIEQIRVDVETGSTYADALKKHPKTFNELYVNMVAAGEAGGILDTILNRLASYIEKAIKLKRKVKGAMIYPSVIVTVAVLVITVIMVFVVPTFSRIFSALGGTLPLPTRIVIGISNFLGGIGGLFILLSIIGFVIFIVQFRRTTFGNRLIDKVLLKFPVFGILIRKVAVAKFTRTLGTLIQSGVPILDGLEITAKTSGNKVIEGAIIETRVSVSEGKSLAEPLMKTRAFPPMVNQMIAVGESTGALDSMLSKIADFYDEEVDIAVANLTAMLEPLLIVFLGVSVGFTVISMYLPIFKLTALMGKGG